MPLDPNRPSAQADLNSRFQEKVASLEASGTLATDLTAPAPTVDAPVVAPAVSAPSAPLPAADVTPVTPPKKDVLPPTGAHAPDDQTAPSTGPAATAIAAAVGTVPANPADAVLGTPPSAAGSTAAAPVVAPVGADPAAAAAATPPEPTDWEDVTVESGVPDVSYKFRAPKDQIEQVKRGFLREADYTRKTMAFGKHREFLTNLVTPDPQNGNRTAMDVLQPILERAMNDNAFGSRMTELYRRVLNGQPTFFSDEIAPGGAAPSGNGHALAAGAVAPAPAGEITLESLGFNAEDPWLEGQLPALRAMVATMNQQQQYINGQRQVQTEQQTSFQQREQVRVEGNRARAFIESKYPGEYDGAEGEQRMIQLYNYANTNGYISQTGSIAAGMLAARVDSDRARIAQAQNTVPSAAAKSLEQAEREAQALAQSATGRVAATVAPPNGVTTPAAPTGAKVALRNGDGSRRNPKTIIQEAAQAALAAQAR